MMMIGGIILKIVAGVLGVIFFGGLLWELFDRNAR